MNGEGRECLLGGTCLRPNCKDSLECEQAIEFLHKTLQTLTLAGEMVENMTLQPEAHPYNLFARAAIRSVEAVRERLSLAPEQVIALLQRVRGSDNDGNTIQ